MKKIKMFMGAVLCMNLLTLSGCDRVVQSAVVEEKDQTEQKKEEKKESTPCGEFSSGTAHLSISEDRCRTGTGTGNIPDNDPGRSKISGPGG